MTKQAPRNARTLWPLALLLCNLAFATRAAEPVTREFADWTLQCDNLRRCVAFTGNTTDGLLLIEREAGPDAGIHVDILGGAADTIDGHRLQYAAPAWTTTSEEADAETLHTEQLAAAQAFIDAIRNGTTLRDADTDDEEGLSLKGLSAALLLMDEVQGRLGTQGALLRRGKRPDSSVPVEPALRVLIPARAPKALDDKQAEAITAAVRRSQSTLLAKEDCEESSSSDEAWPLTDTEALVLVGCWQGAYQSSGPLFRVPRTHPERAVRITFDAPNKDRRIDMLTSADYDVATATLSHFGKGRGLADCGESASWIFNGKAFQLAEYASMNHCVGLTSDRWPTLWRSRTQRAAK